MNSHPVLLVADDERPILDVLDRFARKHGFDVVQCPGGQAAIDHLRELRPDLALLDVRMPDITGLEVLRSIRRTNADCRVVLMTGMADVETAVEAIKAGAQDFMTKPLDFDRLAGLLADVREDAERRQRLLALESDVARRLDFCGMIGRSPAMEELFSLIRRLAPHVRTALVTGETGAGKELVARALHSRGPRSGRRLVTVNCSAIVPTLFESELFGHVRGSFTGASDNKVGLFEHANQGTLFLDEIGELPLSVQAKLLRVMEAGEFQRVGSLETRKVDVLMIAATNRDLRAEVEAGRFRSDLYYRLNVVELQVPALRERREDIPYLVAAFVRDIAERLGKRITGVTPAAERLLLSSAWEGNVRELRNIVERACLLADTEVITDREIGGRLATAPGAPAAAPQSAAATAVPAWPANVTPFPADSMPPSAPAVAPASPESPSAPAGVSEPSDSLRLAEREHVIRVLQQARGNKKAAAARLGVSRRSLYRLLERHGLEDQIRSRGPHGPDSHDGHDGALDTQVA
jgi:DNA-binding NtrC family response regulator